MVGMILDESNLTTLSGSAFLFLFPHFFYFYFFSISVTSPCCSPVPLGRPRTFLESLARLTGRPSGQALIGA